MRAAPIAPSPTSTPSESQGSVPVLGWSQNQAQTTAKVPTPSRDTASSSGRRPRVSRSISGQTRIAIQERGTSLPIRCQPVASRSHARNSGRVESAAAVA